MDNFIDKLREELDQEAKQSATVQAMIQELSRPGSPRVGQMVRTIKELVRLNQTLLAENERLDALCPRRIQKDGKVYRWDAPDELVPMDPN